MKVYVKQADKQVHHTGIAFESTRRDHGPPMYLIICLLMEANEQDTHIFIKQEEVFNPLTGTTAPHVHNPLPSNESK